jgi:hypothetical protein
VVKLPCHEAASPKDGVVVGRIFFLDAVWPQGRRWMRASGHNGQIRRAARGYEPTREPAMATFAKSWRRESGRRMPPIENARRMVARLQALFAQLVPEVAPLGNMHF